MSRGSARAQRHHDGVAVSAAVLAKVLEVLAEFAAGLITHDDARQKVAEIAAAELVIDEAERAKLGV
jgi:hypothetical protein